jgi:hypothetical protein
MMRLKSLHPPRLKTQTHHLVARPHQTKQSARLPKAKQNSLMPQCQTTHKCRQRPKCCASSAYCAACLSAAGSPWMLIAGQRIELFTIETRIVVRIEDRRHRLTPDAARLREFTRRDGTGQHRDPILHGRAAPSQIVDPQTSRGEFTMRLSCRIDRRSHRQASNPIGTFPQRCQTR